MIQCIIIDSEYQVSKEHKFQGDLRKKQQYEKKGYRVNPLGKGNGNWVAIKNVQTLFLLQHGDKQTNVNLAYKIKDFYNAEKMTRLLFETFINEVAQKKIGIYFSEDNEFIIQYT